MLEGTNQMAGKKTYDIRIVTNRNGVCWDLGDISVEFDKGCVDG